ncbi:hypothetical protein AHiyo1_52070, partial [Arthrobacter sp. Hiyo1]
MPVNDFVLIEERELGIAETEVLDSLKQPAGAGDDAVAAAVGQAAG